MSMASNYNSRPRPVEVLIDGDRALEIRSREDTQSLFVLEKRLADAPAR
jgi:diaminopimelate decarboxylase